MRTSLASNPTQREADNELYDQGCDLVAAASAIRRSAGAPEAARAVPAVLGCIEFALQELLWASVALERTSGDCLNANNGPTSRDRAIAERMQRGFANLQQALSDGDRAAAAARSLTGRALAASGAVRPDRSRRSPSA